MKLLWSTILLKVNNKLDLITTSLVGRVWKNICHDKRYSHICKYEEDIMNKIDNYLNERSKQIRKKQMNPMYNNTNAFAPTSTSFIYPQTISTAVNNYYVTPVSSPQFSNETITNEVNNYYVTPINSPQFSNETITNEVNNQVYNEIVPIVPVSIPLSPVSQCSIISSDEDEIISSIFNLSNENSYSTESLNSFNLYTLI